jgi:hypothetical protein
MNRDETIALFERCEAARTEALAAGKDEDEAHEAAKAVWNAEFEPLLAERKRLEEAGEWAAEINVLGQLEGRNDQTEDWLKRALVDFSRCRFVPSPSLQGADAPKQSSDNQDAELDRHGADAPRDDEEISIPLAGGNIDFRGFVFPGHARFASATFSGDARFADATFTGPASFDGATFSGDASFYGATFAGPASFDGAAFSGSAWFDSATFTGPASFGGAAFSGDASFDGAAFTGDAWFGGTTFSANASFDRATFSAHASFNDATFTGPASFGGAAFSGDASFDRATFSANALFHYAIFPGPASFGGAAFSADAWFHYATFFTATRFDRAIFSADALFDRATFSANTSFVQALFKGPANFSGCTFEKDASFRLIRSETGFDLSDAEFGQVPDFTQSTLHRDPRLDNVKVARGSLIGPVRREVEDDSETWMLLWRIMHHVIDTDAPAKFRELKRYAIQGEDHRSELEFHAQEIRTSRFAIDKWWHPRFWFGVLYEIFSDFGRSIIRPALAMAGIAAIFAAYFLSVSAGLSGRAPDYRALFTFQSQPCIRASANSLGNLRTGQAQIAATTDATTEAWSLALKKRLRFHQLGPRRRRAA